MKTFLAVFFGVLAAVLVIVVIITVILQVRRSEERDAARSQARMEIESLKAVHCTPDIAEEFESANTRHFKDELNISSLDSVEKEHLEVAFANGMELAGCGPGAQLQQMEQLKVERARKEKEARKAWAHRNGAVWVTSFPPGSTVIVDGQLAGETPISLTPSPGHHILRAVLLGYKSVDDSFDVVPGEEKNIAIDMGARISQP
jgi:hypothetical protein